jgi:hypothetical protein
VVTVQYHNRGVRLDFCEGGISLVLRFVKFHLKRELDYLRSPFVMKILPFTVMDVVRVMGCKTALIHHFVLKSSFNENF